MLVFHLHQAQELLMETVNFLILFFLLYIYIIIIIFATLTTIKFPHTSMKEFIPSRRKLILLGIYNLHH
jgi:hypothetical protein